MIDRENVIKKLSELHGSKETMEIIEQAIALLKEQMPHKETFWDSLSEADLMEPMHHFED